MNRRSYLRCSAGLLAVTAGCTGENTGDGNGNANGSERTPYADSTNDYETAGGEIATHSFSGSEPSTDDEPTYTEPFDLSTDGPTIVEYEHDGEDSFNVWFVDEDDERVTLGTSAVGPFVGRSIHALDPGTYGLSVTADDEWSIDVTDLPVYNTGQQPPITRAGILVDVLGPIEFPDDAETEFTLTASGGGGHIVDLFTREGELAVRIFGTDDDVDAETEVAELGGVGYLLVESGGEWEISIDSAD